MSIKRNEKRSIPLASPLHFMRWCLFYFCNFRDILTSRVFEAVKAMHGLERVGQKELCIIERLKGKEKEGVFIFESLCAKRDYCVQNALVRARSDEVVRGGADRAVDKSVSYADKKEKVDLVENVKVIPPPVTGSKSNNISLGIVKFLRGCGLVKFQVFRVLFFKYTWGYRLRRKQKMKLMPAWCCYVTVRSACYRRGKDDEQKKRLDRHGWVQALFRVDEKNALIVIENLFGKYHEWEIVQAAWWLAMMKKIKKRITNRYLQSDGGTSISFFLQSHIQNACCLRER